MVLDRTAFILYNNKWLFIRRVCTRTSDIYTAHKYFKGGATVFKARIADFNVLFKEHYNLLYLNIGDFAAEFETPDITVVTTLEDIVEEERTSDTPRRPYKHELSRAFRNFAEQLPDHGACVFHSCFIEVDGRGIAFSARSGTGKTTHMGLWQKMLGERMKIVNGDKPIVRFLDGVPYGYGTPWRGKEGLGGKERAPLTDICIIERAAENETLPVSPEEGMLLLVQQIYMPKTSEGIAKTMDIISRLTEKCRFWRIRCNMEPDAALTAYNAIFNKGEHI